MNANNRAHKLCCMSKIVDRWHDMDQDLQEQLGEFWTGDTMQGIRQEFMDGKMPKVCDWYCGRYEREKVWEESNRMHFISKYADHEETSHRNYENLGLDVVHGNLLAQRLHLRDALLHLRYLRAVTRVSKVQQTCQTLSQTRCKRTNQTATSQNPSTQLRSPLSRPFNASASACLPSSPLFLF